MNLQLSSYERLAEKDLFCTVSEICSLLIARDARPYFVGGCVRDALLDHDIFDFDIEIFGIGPEKIVEILSSKYELLPQECFIRDHASFGVFKVKGFNIDLSVPRAEKKIGDKHGSFSITLLPDCTVQEAASRRDFTINAIYFDVKNNVLSDPYNGVEDLKNKILKNISARFSEDPLRVLRGMQFIGRFGLTPTDGLVEYASTLTPNELSPERIFLEWKKLLLLGEYPSLGLRFLAACGWTRFFPEIHALITCEQDPDNHPEGTVFNHTCLAIDLFARDRVEDIHEDLVVGFATLCHDFGKPLTTTCDEFGMHHYGHDAAGVPLVENFLQRIRAPNWVLDEVIPLVKYHMSLRGDKFKMDDKHRESALLRLANKVGRIDRLLRVCTYDGYGRGGIQGNPDSEKHIENMIKWAHETANKFDVLDHPPVPIIQGRDLVALGLSPSSMFKTILEDTFEAQLDRVFIDHEGGMKYVRSILDMYS